MAFTAKSMVQSANTFNFVGGEQINYPHYGPFSEPTPQRLLTFNDAPIDFLSTHFTGREQELEHMQQVFDVTHGNIPTRCSIRRMHGLGKTQLTLQFANLSFDPGRYSHIFWSSATTVEKLHQGFARVLQLVGLPDRHVKKQSNRTHSGATVAGRIRQL